MVTKKKPAVVDMTAAEARAAIKAIRVTYLALIAQVQELWDRRAWIALGHSSWESMCKAEFEGLRLPPHERKAANIALRSKGMSTRAVGAATGSGHATVIRDTSTGPNGPVVPARVAGVDGRTYTSKPATKPATNKPKTVSVSTARRQMMQPSNEPVTLVDLNRRLSQLIAFMAVIQVDIDELGVEVVKSDAGAVTAMLDASHLIAALFAPFVSAEGIEKAATEWAKLP